MDNFINPLISAILSWATLGVLGVLVSHLKTLGRHMQLMERSSKALMRADLIRRYKHYRDDGGWISDANRDEWLNDYQTYSELNGTNGYLDDAREDIKDMPAHPAAEAENK